MIFLDTHVLVWLYLNSTEKISKKAQELINQNDIFISPIVSLELSYMYEIGRITQPASIALDFLSVKMGLSIKDVSVRLLVEKAQTLTWTRDPFDRLIVAHASLNNDILLSKDRLILDNYARARW